MYRILRLFHALKRFSLSDLSLISSSWRDRFQPWWTSQNRIVTPLLSLNLKIYYTLLYGFYRHFLKLEVVSVEKDQLLVSLDRSPIPIILLVLSIFSCVFPSAYISLRELMYHEGIASLTINFYCTILAYIGVFVFALDAVVFTNPQIVNAANELIAVFQRQKKQPGWSQEDPTKLDIVGFITTIITEELVLPSFVIPVLMVITNKDVWFYIFKLHASPEISQSLPVLCTRLVLAFVYLVEYVRVTFLFGILGLIIVFTTKRILSTLERNCTNQNTVASLTKYYIQLELVFILMRESIERVFLVVVSGTQVYFSVLIWLCIIHWEKLPTSMRSFWSAAAGSELGAIIVILVYMGAVCEGSDNLVKEQRKRLYSRKNGVHGSSANSVFYWKTWNARRKLGIKYGIGLEFQKNTAMEYLEVLSNNIANLVLLTR